MADVRVVTTGGTIDKIYFDALSEFEVGEPQAGPVLTEANVTFRWEVTSVVRKDSNDLTDDDRAAIVAAVADCPERHVLVTHGTDGLVATAQLLEQAALGKVVVLTGAMQPARQRRSDATFNIGFAVGVLRSRDAGVWVAMNGHAFAPAEVRKDREGHRFVATDPAP